MWLRSQECRCRVGFYFKPADGPDPAMCVKCADICKYVCKGPPTKLTVGGKETLTSNNDCPSTIQDAIASADLGEETWQEKENYRASKRFYLVGQPCHGYFFNDLYFYLPSSWGIYKIKQDYNFANFPSKEHRLLGITYFFGTPNHEVIQPTACTMLHDASILFFGVEGNQYIDYTGLERFSHTVITRPYLIAYEFNFVFTTRDSVSLIAIARRLNLVVAASLTQKLLIEWRTIRDMRNYGFGTRVTTTDYFPLRLTEVDGKHALVLWKDAPIRGLYLFDNNGSTLAAFPKSPDIIGRDMNADYT